MAFAIRNHGGLFVADTALDETSVNTQLKQTCGREFALHFRRDDGDRTNVYKVVHVPTGSIVFTWMDDHGNYLPLSSALVDAFRSHMHGSRVRPMSEDDHNRRMVEVREADAERERDALISDHKPYWQYDRKQVAFTGTSKPRYWRTENAKPKSGRKRG